MSAHRRPVSAGAVVVIVGVAALCGAGSARANASLDKCRNLEREFDYKGMLTECGVAAAEPNTSKDERLETFRLLGIAHATLGEGDKARVWFLKLLTLQPDFTLPPDASPKFRESFADAQATFQKEGIVSVVHTPAGVDEQGRPKPVVFDVTDKLGRVGQAKVRVQAVAEGKTYPQAEAALLRQDGSGPTAQYSGEVPDPVMADPRSAPAAYSLRYELVLTTPSGDLVQPATPLAPVDLQVAGPEAAAGADIPWLWIGAGTGAAVLVAGVATGVGLGWCYTLGPCREPVLRIAWVKVTVPQDAE